MADENDLQREKAVADVLGLLKSATERIEDRPCAEILKSAGQIFGLAETIIRNLCIRVEAAEARVTAADHLVEVYLRMFPGSPAVEVAIEAYRVTHQPARRSRLMVDDRTYDIHDYMEMWPAVGAELGNREFPSDRRRPMANLLAARALADKLSVLSLALDRNHSLRLHLTGRTNLHPVEVLRESEAILREVDRLHVDLAVVSELRQILMEIADATQDPNIPNKLKWIREYARLGIDKVGLISLVDKNEPPEKSDNE